MNCISCGQKIPAKAIEGSDFLNVKSDVWCKPCAIEKLSRWPEFERYERLSEEGYRYRNSLIDTLKWAINEGYCMKPKERCEASAEKCLRCWLLHLVGEREES
jgi:hypothetical protein